MRFVALVVAVAIPATAVRAANTPSKFAKEHLAAAALLNAGKWDAATAAYRSLLKRGPEDTLVANAAYGLALALDGAGEHDAALAALRSLDELVNERKEAGTLGGQQPIEAWRYPGGDGPHPRSE